MSGSLNAVLEKRCPREQVHEFVHLWNVKRIRPQTLEPVDYTKENYTRALWFSEGVTSTVQGYILLQAGLLDERRYLQRLGDQITTLQQRSAHKTQSAEESSLDAWLEKYTYYREPDRSISYYNKGELLGVLLDLKIREGSQFTASLRELFQWMNKHYAGQGKFFDDSEGVRQAAQSVCKCDLQEFFDHYVSGTDEIPWDPMLSSVGLRVVQQSVEVADAGLDVQRVFGGMALSLNEGSRGLLMDPFNGAADIENKLLRVIQNYAFLEDPSRLIRATRFAARFHWPLEERTQQRYDSARENNYIDHVSHRALGHGGIAYVGDWKHR